MAHEVLIFVGADFERKVTFDVEAEARAYAMGCHSGAGFFGGDDLNAYVLPGDEEEIAFDWAGDDRDRVSVAKTLFAARGIPWPETAP